MEVVLASCYDKLKAFDPSLDVIGVGLSPRGNDNPGASSNSSISPVRWIKALGDAYRASGRHEAALRRVVVALLSERQHRRGRDRLRVAEHGLRQRGTREARALGRLQRHRSADAAGYPVDTSGSTLYGNTAGRSSTRRAGRSTHRTGPVTRTTRTCRSSRSRSRRRTTTSSSTSRTVSRRSPRSTSST